jgi:hypothetical protein
MKKKRDFLIIYITKKWKLINEPQQSSKAYKKSKISINMGGSGGVLTTLKHIYSLPLCFPTYIASNFY